MVEASPKIAYESQSLSIPIFPSNALLMSFARSQTAPLSSQKSLSKGQSQTLSSQAVKPCHDCPHVLVCDDDPFQAMYYKMLFEDLANPSKDPQHKIELRLEVFSAGEGLLDRFLKTSSCKCRSLQLVITDYYMGIKKLNGVETLKKLRESGFEGPIVLRSSEEMNFLCTEHSDFEVMLKSGFISHFIEKSNLRKAKEVIQDIIKAKFC